MNDGKVTIRRSRKSDLKAYASLIQESAQTAYTNKRIGLPSSLFSEKVFASDGLQQWLKSNLYPSPDKKTWLAFAGKRLVGAITVKVGKRNELRGFYIATDAQGKGIGKALYSNALRISKGKDIVLTMYPHNPNTLAIYKKWGFRKIGRPGYHHWSSWPEGIRMRYTRMLLKRK